MTILKTVRAPTDNKINVTTLINEETGKCKVHTLISVVTVLHNFRKQTISCRVGWIDLTWMHCNVDSFFLSVYKCQTAQMAFHNVMLTDGKRWNNKGRKWIIYSPHMQEYPVIFRLQLLNQGNLVQKHFFKSSQGAAASNQVRYQKVN